MIDQIANHEGGDNVRAKLNSVIDAVNNMTGTYGSMYAYSLASGFAVTVTVVDTWYQIASGVSQGTVSGVTFQNARELKILTAGTYHIMWALSLEAGVNAQEVEGGIMIDGVINTSFSSHSDLANSGKSMTLSGSGIIALSVNKLVSLAVLNHTAGNNITIDHLTLSLVWMGA